MSSITVLLMTKREEKQVNSIVMRFYAIINGCGFQLNNLQGRKPPSRNISSYAPVQYVLEKTEVEI